MIRFRVLGPLVSGDRTPSAAKHRTLVAALLANANRGVSTAALVDELWGDRPPRTAATTLQVYVCQLRKDIGADRLRTVPTGYRIDAGDTELDLLRFRGQAGAARRAFEAGDYARATSGYREALALWRGPAFEGVRLGAGLDVALAQLTEQRLVALEQRVSADLRLGRHADIVEELVDLAAGNPLREMLQAHLMVALYRTDRRADALRVFAGVRHAVTEELGVEPGTGLQRLHERILREDRNLLWHDETPAMPSPPRQAPSEQSVWLPPLPRHVVGRESELTRARTLLADGPLVVSGRPGVGKTTLAVALAERMADDAPGGRVLVALRAPDGTVVEPEQITRQLVRYLTQDGADAVVTADSGIALRQLLAESPRVLVVLDDAVTVRQVRALLPALTGATVVITSHSPLAGLDGVGRVGISTLPSDVSADLLNRITGRTLPAKVADGIAALCGGLPLALRVATAVLTARPHWDGWDLLARLEDTGAALDTLRADDLSVRDSLLAGYRAAGPELQHAFRTLVLIPSTGFGPELAAAALGCGSSRALTVLDDLVDAHLLDVVPAPVGQDRVGYHHLLRTLAVELRGGSDDAAEVLARIGAIVLDTARAADAAVVPGRRPAFAGPTRTVPLDWFQEEAGAVLRLIRAAHQAGLWHLVVDLADAMVGYYSTAVIWDDWAASHELAALAAARTGDPDAQALVHCGLAELAWQRQRFAEAERHFRAAVPAYVESDDRRGQVRCLVGLGDIALGRDETTVALDYFTKALRLCGGNLVRGRAEALRGLALVSARLGQQGDARRCFEQLLESADSLLDRRLAEFARRGGQRGSDGAALEMHPGIWLVA